MKRIIQLLRILVGAFIVCVLAAYVLGYNAYQSRNLHTNPILISNGGNGSKEKPYEIATEEQFISLRDSVNRGYSYEDCFFLQIDDLNFQNYGAWEPIGPVDTPFIFYGYYDGGGHTISGIDCRADALQDDNGVALFGRMAGTIINLGIVDSRFEGKGAASIAYTSWGRTAKIINCYSTSEVIAQESGSGIAHYFGGYIVNCWYGGEITGSTTFSISSGNPIAIFSTLGSQPMYGSKFSGYFAGSADIIEKETALSYLNDHIAESSVYLQMDKKQFVSW